TPFITNYRPQFFFRTTDVVGTLELTDGVELAMPGDRVEVTVELGRPVPMDPGLGFAVREGGRTVGAGAVTALLGGRPPGRGTLPGRPRAQPARDGARRVPTPRGASFPGARSWHYSDLSLHDLR